MVKNQKAHWFFFEILIDRIHSNNPKKPSFFLLFHLRKKEKHIGNATKNIFWVKTKHFTIFCLAWVFFCFSRFCLLFSMWPKLLELQVPSSGPAQRVSKYCFFLCKYGCRHYWLHERVKQMIRLKQTRGWSGHKNFESAIAIEPECIRYYNYNPNVLNHSCAETCPPDDVTNDDIAMLRKGSGCVCVWPWLTHLPRPHPEAYFNGISSTKCIEKNVCLRLARQYIRSCKLMVVHIYFYTPHTYVTFDWCKSSPQDLRQFYLSCFQDVFEGTLVRKFLSSRLK